MHIRTEVELLPLDPELERTLRNLKKVRIIEVSVMARRDTAKHSSCRSLKTSEAENYGRKVFGDRSFGMILGS